MSCSGIQFYSQNCFQKETSTVNSIKSVVPKQIVIKSIILMNFSILFYLNDVKYFIVVIKTGLVVRNVHIIYLFHPLFNSPLLRVPINFKNTHIPLQSHTPNFHRTYTHACEQTLLNVP